MKKYQENWLKYKLVKVEWVDSSFSEGWIDKDTCDFGIAHISSAGYLVKEEKDFIALALNIGEQISDIINIPKRCIVSMNGLYVDELIVKNNL